MTDKRRPGTEPKPNKEHEVHQTRKMLEEMGVGDDKAPAPEQQLSGDMDEGRDVKLPGQASIQPAAAGLKGKLANAHDHKDLRRGPRDKGPRESTTR